MVHRSFRIGKLKSLFAMNSQLNYNKAMSQYLIVLIVSGCVPFVLSLFPPIRLFRNGKALGMSLGLIVFIFGAWDVFATYRGHWYFNPQSVYAVRIINLPIEEVLFFMVIPFCCIFSWEVIKFFKEKLR
ncbi:lycopene cyclase domain-containing protein [Candidatus Omnitrophota bacterium]